MLENKKFQNFLLLVLLIGVVLAIVSKFFPSLDTASVFTASNMMRAFFLLVLLFFIGGFLFNRRGANVESSGTSMIVTAAPWLAWILIFFIVIVGYAFRHELDYFKKRVVSVLLPSYTFVEDGEIILARRSDGHFYVKTIANDRIEIKFLIDTGATGVAITKQDAINMGLDLDKLDYSMATSTANGIAYSAPIKIKKLQIGEKVLYNVSAHVTSGGLDISLLGMSVIDDFSDFRFTNDNLLLKY